MRRLAMLVALLIGALSPAAWAQDDPPLAFDGFVEFATEAHPYTLLIPEGWSAAHEEETAIIFASNEDLRDLLVQSIPQGLRPVPRVSDDTLIILNVLPNEQLLTVGIRGESLDALTQSAADFFYGAQGDSLTPAAVELIVIDDSEDGFAEASLVVGRVDINSETLDEMLLLYPYGPDLTLIARVATFLGEREAAAALAYKMLYSFRLNQSPEEYVAAVVEPCVASASYSINQREGPGLNFARIGSLPGGHPANVIGHKTGADDINWWKLDGDGWVRSNIVTTTGDCYLVPELAG